jgi:hypothetical protein
MPKSVHIPAPQTTHEERVKQLHIPKDRLKELQALVDEFKARLAHRQEPPQNPIEPEMSSKSVSAA